MQVERFLRGPQVWKPGGVTGKSRAAIYDDVAKGLFPPPIQIGERISVWLESEVAAIQAARIRGLSNDELRTLVGDLVSSRVTRTQALPKQATDRSLELSVSAGGNP